MKIIILFLLLLLFSCQDSATNSQSTTGFRMTFNEGNFFVGGSIAIKAVDYDASISSCSWMINDSLLSENSTTLQLSFDKSGPCKISCQPTYGNDSVSTWHDTTLTVTYSEKLLISTTPNKVVAHEEITLSLVGPTDYIKSSYWIVGDSSFTTASKSTKFTFVDTGSIKVKAKAEYFDGTFSQEAITELNINLSPVPVATYENQSFVKEGYYDVTVNNLKNFPLILTFETQNGSSNFILPANGFKVFGSSYGLKKNSTYTVKGEGYEEITKTIF